MMALLTTAASSSSVCPLLCRWNGVVRVKHPFASSSVCARKKKGGGSRVVRTSASSNNCPFNPTQQPILKEALKEPVAFLGGMFAGLLRLDLNEDPLKEWVTRTVEASGITEEEIVSGDVQEDEVPQEIQIE